MALAYLKAQVEPQIRLAKIERLAWVQDGGVDGWVIRTALWWKLVDHPIIGQAGTAARPYLASVRSKTESG